MAQSAVNLNKNDEVDIPWGSDLQLGLRWDFNDGKKVDLDASAVVFDNNGVLLDAVFYNQKQTQDRSIIHSGDNRSGEGEGDDESVTIISSLIHPVVRVIAIVVNAYRGGDFSDVKTARVVVRDLTYGVELVNMNLPQCGGHHHGLVVAILYRNNFGQWRIRNTYRKAEGRNFKESEYKIRKILKEIIPEDQLIRNWNYAQASFNLEKNQTFVIPNINHIIFGLGWDLNSSSTIDLDGSVVAFMENPNSFLESDTVYFGHKTNNNRSIEHSGDNLTGAGDGDDEQIHVKLNDVPKSVKYLFFTVNIYTLDRTFEQVKNAYVRLLDHSNNNREICRFMLKDCGKDNAIILAKVYNENNEWRIEAIGEPRKGRTFRDLVPTILSDFINHTPPAPPAQKTKSLLISVLEGKNLPAMDRGGTSDPYVIILTNKNEKWKTQCIKKTLNPVWNYQLEIKGETKFVVFEVYDKDLLKDDLMGYVKINIEELPFDSELDLWREVQKLKNSPGGGEIHIRIKRVSNW